MPEVVINGSFEEIGFVENILNGGYEIGNLDYWTKEYFNSNSPSTTSVYEHSGTLSARLPSPFSSGWNKIYQSFSPHIIINDITNFSCYAYKVQTESIKSIIIYYDDESATYYEPSIPGGTWTFLNLKNIIIPYKNAIIKVEFRNEYPYAAYYIDDVILQTITSSPVGWELSGGELTGAEYHSGTLSCLQYYSSYVKQDIGTIPTDLITSYTIWVKKETGDYNLSVEWTFDSIDGGAINAYYEITGIPADGQWHEVDLLTPLLNVAEGRGLCLMSYFMGSGGFTDWYLDDVSLIYEEEEPPLPPPPPPEKDYREIIFVQGNTFPSDCISTSITRKENAIDDALIYTNDFEGKMYLNQVNLGDFVQIYYIIPGNTIQVFEGTVVELNPRLDIAGEICAVKCYGIGMGLANMRVQNEYGTESKNPVQCTLRSILAGEEYGMIENHVNKIFGTTIESGYSIDTLYIDNNLSATLTYLNYPFKPTINVLEDIGNLISAANFLDEDNWDPGIHWVVLPDNGIQRLCVATVGDHESCSPGTLLYTLWPSYHPSGTLEVGKNIVSSNFTQVEPEANYIVAAGKFEYPPKEIWTENATLSTYWSVESGFGTMSTYGPKVGSYCLQIGSGVGGFSVHTKAGLINLSPSDIGSSKNLPTISFYIRADAFLGSDMDPNPNGIWIGLYYGPYYENKRFVCGLSDLVTINAGTWTFVEITFGPWSTNEEWVALNNPSWASINCIEFAGYPGCTGALQISIDDLRINGIAVRGAYNSSKFPVKMKLITDSLAKDSALWADDDSKTLPQLAKGELIRSMLSPIQGNVITSLNPEVLPGQLVTIHNPRNLSFGTNGYKEFRILEVRHNFSISGCTTELVLTDDIKNSFPILPLDAYNMILKASNPDYQDRDRGDLKAKDLDSEVPVLAKDYS